MADVITRLKVESTEYDSKIKRASQGLLQMEQACRKVGGTLAILEKDELDFVKGLGKMGTVSKDARGQLNELTKAFTDLSLQYKRLTDEEKKGDFGKALASSLGELKSRIQETKANLASVNQELNGSESKFGKLGGIIDGVGRKFGVTGNLTEMLTSKTALMYAGIGAGVAIVGKASDAMAKYNKELAKQDQITTVTTGLKGSGANNMTDTMRALADTYQVDFREAINAANTLMSQFGESGDSAIKLIKDGMQGMIMGDGGKLLQMIQQYAPAFRDAGVSASQLIAVIHNSEGGIFTDQNMNAIVMGIKNIRLMSNSTSEALAKLGIDGKKMSEQLNNGSLTVFEALKQVASELKKVDSNSQTAGEVMQNVFGKQGVTAGTNIAKAIETLNTNLDETKKQTGDLGDAYADLQTANEKLNVAIRDCFGYDGWEQMATGLKAKLVTALSDVLNVLDGIRSTWSDLMQKMGLSSGTNVTPIGGDLSGLLPNKVSGPAQQIAALRNATDKRGAYNKQVSQYDAQISQLKGSIAAMGDPIIPEVKAALESQKKQLQELQQMRASYIAQAQEIINPKTTPTGGTGGSGKGGKGGGANASEVVGQLHGDTRDFNQISLKSLEDATQVTTKSMNELQAELKKYKDMLANATTQSEYQTATAGITSTQNKIAAQPIALEMGVTLAEAEVMQQAQSMKENLEAYFKENPLKIDTTGAKTLKKEAKANEEAWTAVSNSLQSAASALGSFNDPALNIASTIATSLANVALAFSQALKGTATPWDFIAGVAGGVAAMASAVAAIKSIASDAEGYALGGVVQGNTYSGDQIPAMLNAGETVLTRAQAGVIASALEGNNGNGSNGTLQAVISSNNIKLCLQNGAVKEGKTLGNYLGL